LASKVDSANKADSDSKVASANKAGLDNRVDSVSKVDSGAESEAAVVEHCRDNSAALESLAEEEFCQITSRNLCLEGSEARQSLESVPLGTPSVAELVGVVSGAAWVA
jgi:hypothetical protein